MSLIAAKNPIAGKHKEKCNNSIHLFKCLTTARKGQLQPSTKTTVQDKI
jgi:hypothetical protein